MLSLYFMQTFLQPLMGTVASFFQLALRNRGWSYSLAGVVTAMGQVTTIAGPVLISLVAERHSKEKKALILCIVLSLLFHIPFFLSENVVFTGFCYVAACAFFWSLPPLADGLIGKHCRGNRELYGRIRACGTLGYVVAMLMFSLLSFPSENNNFQMMLNNTAFSVVLLFTVLSVPSAEVRISSSAEESGESDKDGGDPGKAVREKVFDFRWFDRSFYIFIFFVSISRVAMAVVDKMLASYMVEQLNLGMRFTSFVALGALAEFFCMLHGARILKNNLAGPFRLIIISCAGLSFRLLLCGLTDNIYVFAFSQLFHGLAFGLFHVACVDWISNHVKKEHYSFAISFYHSAGLNLPVLFGSLTGGCIVDLFGYRTLFFIYALFPVLSIVFGVLCRKNLKKENSCYSN